MPRGMDKRVGTVWPAQSRKIPDFLWKSRCFGARTDRPAVTRKKKRFLMVARNRMISASGFTWFAREPELIYGAEGRASSQRSVEYHSRPRPRQLKLFRIIARTGRFTTVGWALFPHSLQSLIYLDATAVQFDAIECQRPNQRPSRRRTEVMSRFPCVTAKICTGRVSGR